jgi:hypothetical protein
LGHGAAGPVEMIEPAVERIISAAGREHAPIHPMELVTMAM